MCNVHFILTLTPPWLQVKVAKYFDFGNLDVWLVAVCVRFSSETTRPISPMMISINSGNNVDVQHALHFDLHPSMTAGQGHKILQFCELRLLPWHECWYISGPYKVAGDRLDLVLLDVIIRWPDPFTEWFKKHIYLVFITRHVSVIRHSPPGMPYVFVRIGFFFFCRQGFQTITF